MSRSTRILVVGGGIAGMTAEGESYANNLYRLCGDWMAGTSPIPAREAAAPSQWQLGAHRLELLRLDGHTGDDLVLRDLSTGGAKIHVSALYKLPPRFVLLQHQAGVAFEVILKWRRGDLAGVKVDLYGSDLSERCMEKAQSGLYTQFEVQRGLPIRMLVDHFDKVEDSWRLSPRIRQRVRWRRINLAADLSGVGRFDHDPGALAALMNAGHLPSGQLVGGARGGVVAGGVDAVGVALLERGQPRPATL